MKRTMCGFCVVFQSVSSPVAAVHCASADRGSTDKEICNASLHSKEGAARFRRDDLGDHARPRVGGKSAAQSLPDQKHERED